MEENRFNQTLRDKFQDLESPFNDRVTFEAVMKKREKKKRRVIFWLPSVAVVAGLFLSAGMGYMLLSDSGSAEKSPQVALKEVVVKPAKKPIVESHKQYKVSTQGTEMSRSDFSFNEDVSQQLKVGAQARTGQDKGMKGNRGISFNSHRDQSKSSSNPINLESLSEKLDLIDLKQTNHASNNATVYQSKEAEATHLVQGVNIGENPLIFCDPRGIYPVSIGVSTMKEEFVEIPEGEFEKTWDPGRYRSKWYGELGASTGSKVIVDFDNKNELSILGTMYHANYQGLILRDLGNGIMLGSGLSYGEWIGNGEWQLTQTERKTFIDSYDLVVMIPPVQTVRVYDTSEVIDVKLTTGEIHYKIDKVSVPLAIRYNMMLGKLSWRLAAQINPGITTKTSGDFFTKTEYHPILEQRMFSMDAKLAFGPSFALTSDWTLVLEPNTMLHSFYDKAGKRSYSKVLTGFGMTVVRKF